MSAENNRKKSDELCEKAEHLAQSGDLEKAAEFIKQAVKCDEGNSRAWRELFKISLGTGDVESALSAITSYLNLEPDDFTGWSTLGSLLKDLDMLAESEEAHLRATQIKPDEFMCWYNLGVLYEITDMQKAKTAYEKAIECNPRDADTYYNLGNVLVALDDIKGAVKAVKNSIELNPHDPDAWDNLAMMLCQLNQLKEAEAAARKALELNPQHSNASGRLGAILLQLGDAEGAKQYLQQSTAINPKSAVDFYNFSLACQAVGDKVEAARAMLIAEELGIAEKRPRKKLVSTKCSQYNHPEFVLYVDSPPIPEEWATWIIDYLEKDVASGAVYKPDETFQLGWMVTKIFEDEGRLCVCEPHFVDMPIQWVNSISKTVRDMFVQHAVLESVGLEDQSDFPSILDVAIVCKRFGEDKSAFRVDRATLEDDFPANSGWFICCGFEDCCGSEQGTEFYGASLYQVATINPAVVKYLALPRGISVKDWGDPERFEISYMEKPLQVIPKSLLAEMLSARVPV